MEHLEKRIVVETARYRVTGALRLPRDGYRSRLTDFLNASDREFIALTDVQVETLDDPAPPEHRRFVAVALRHVVPAAPWTNRTRAEPGVEGIRGPRWPAPVSVAILSAMATSEADEVSGLSRSEALRASPRMFDNDLLDKLSRVHPSVPPVLFLPAITILLVEGFIHGVGVAAVAWVLGGYLFWTLTEYWLHRIVFHFEPEKGIGARLHWIIHGVHHDHPNDPMRLVMPPSLSIPLAALFIWGFYAVLGSPAFLPFGAGFLAGYLAYDMLHYHVHHHRPSSALGKKLRELHMRHHFQDHDRGYGVSAPFWDHVFGTAPKSR